MSKNFSIYSYIYTILYFDFFFSKKRKQVDISTFYFITILKTNKL